MKKKILYIEDDKDTAQSFELLLKKDYDIDLAYTAKKGLEKIKTKKYDLIVIDILLPDESGFILFNKIKNVKTKKVFLSAYEFEERRIMEFKKEGLAQYILKPFDKNCLQKEFKKILED